MDQRELSPESRVFSTPAPPSGTKKRPSKRPYTRFLDAEDPVAGESSNQAIIPNSTNAEASSRYDDIV